MAITIIQQPAALSFSRNPVVISLQTDARYRTIGRKYVARINWTYDAPSQYSVSITFKAKTYIFQITPDPDDSGLQIINRQVASAQQYAKILADGFASNRDLSEAFDFTVAGDGASYWVVMTAGEASLQYVPSVFQSYYMSLTMLQSPITAELNPNYKMLVELWVQKEGQQPERLSDPFMEPDENGIVTLDLSGQLTDAMLADGFDQPDLGNAVARTDTRSVLKYFIKYADAYGETQTVRKLSRTQLYTTMLGGISNEKLAEFAFPGYFIAGTLLKWLKQEPMEKYIQPDQPEFLSVMLFNGLLTGLKVKFELTYEDDSVSTLYKFNMGAKGQYSKLTFPVGYLQNNLDLMKDDLYVVSYTVTLQDNAGTNITEAKKYFVDYTYYPYTRYFVYLSSWGTYDTLVTYGRNSNQYKLTQNSAELVTGKEFQLATGDNIVYSVSLNHTETVTSGYRPKAEIRSFRDLALSLDMLLFRKGRAYAVAFTSTSVKEFKEGDTLRAITFEYGLRYDEELFTIDDLDDQDDPKFMPRMFLGGPAAPDDHNHDDRYYTKLQTFTKAETQLEIDIRIQATKDRLLAAETKLDQLQTDLAGKSDKGHVHDDRYIPRADMQDLLDQLQVVLDEGAGLDPDDIDDTLKFEAGKLGVDLTKVTSRADFDILVGALVPHPTYTAPSATLTSNVSASGEVGETRALTVSLSFTQGHAGQAYGNAIRKNGAQVAVGASFTETIKLATGAVAYQGTISYNQGAVRKNIIGIDDPVGRIEAGSKDSNTINFIGYYATWYGPAGSIPATAAAPRTLSGKQLTSAGNSFTLNSGTVQTTLVIITAPGKSLSSVVDLDALNAVITSEYVYQGTMSVNDADGVAVAGFKIYVKQMGVPYGSNHRHQVTTA